MQAMHMQQQPVSAVGLGRIAWYPSVVTSIQLGLIGSSAAGRRLQEVCCAAFRIACVLYVSLQTWGHVVFALYRTFVAYPTIGHCIPNHCEVEYN